MEVQPITSKNKIINIKKHLNDNPRNLLIFTLGINSGLRMGDILKLEVHQVEGKEIGDTITIKEGKTKKENHFKITKAIHEVLTRHLKELPTDTEYLFPSRKGNSHITVGSVTQLIKEWCKSQGIKDNVGCHTLRKTFGYFQRKHYKVKLPILMARFNHSSQDITMRYIGITKKEVSDILDNEI